MLIFWVVKLCGLAGRNRRFGGTYCLHHQDWNVGISLRVYTAFLPRRPALTSSPSWEPQISYMRSFVIFTLHRILLGGWSFEGWDRTGMWHAVFPIKILRYLSNACYMPWPSHLPPFNHRISRPVLRRMLICFLIFSSLLSLPVWHLLIFSSALCIRPIIISFFEKIYINLNLSMKVCPLGRDVFLSFAGLLVLTGKLVASVRAVGPPREVLSPRRGPLSGFEFELWLRGTESNVNRLYWWTFVSRKSIANIAQGRAARQSHSPVPRV
jgi:hypothetical protein